jgi:hypothetical protein
MARRNISLPDDVDRAARQAQLNVSALAQRAVVDELDRRRRMAALDALLDELDAEHGRPSARAEAAAKVWLDSAVALQPPQKRNAVSRPPRKQRATG